MTQSAREIIEELNLMPHPEGGWYRETWRSDVEHDGRASGTAIYYLLEGDDVSHWHRVDSCEMWHWYSGGPLSLTMSEDGVTANNVILGPGVLSGQRPQVRIPPGWWQCAASLGGWTLVGCTVSPGFEFPRFELAPKDWKPGEGHPPSTK